jgi:hypothetical protein
MQNRQPSTVTHVLGGVRSEKSRLTQAIAERAGVSRQRSLPAPNSRPNCALNPRDDRRDASGRQDSGVACADACRFRRKDTRLA